MLIHVDASGLGAVYSCIQRSMFTQILQRTIWKWCTNTHRQISGSGTSMIIPYQEGKLEFCLQIAEFG